MDTQTLEKINELELKLEVHESILVSLIARLNNISLQEAGELVKNMTDDYLKASPLCGE
jgi:hypothetical protein